MREIEETSVYSVEDFMREVVPILGHNRFPIYRGQPNAGDPIIPKLLRNLLDASQFSTWEELETAIILKFKQRAQQGLGFEPHSELEWRAIGAHFGLSSRMTAWSSNSLVALFFACLADYGEDGVVYRVIPMDDQMFISQDFEQVPESPRFYTPRHSNPQLQAQRTYFLSHPMPEFGTSALSFEDQYESGEGRFDLVRIVIPAGCKREILRSLALFGIDPISMFGGLGSVADQIDHEIPSHTDAYDHCEQFPEGDYSGEDANESENDGEGDVIGG